MTPFWRKMTRIKEYEVMSNHLCHEAILEKKMTQITECYVMLNCLHRNDANHRKRRTIYIITPFWRKNDMNHQI